MSNQVPTWKFCESLHYVPQLFTKYITPDRISDQLLKLSIQEKTTFMRELAKT